MFVSISVSEIKVCVTRYHVLIWLLVSDKSRDRNGMRLHRNNPIITCIYDLA